MDLAEGLLSNRLLDQQAPPADQPGRGDAGDAQSAAARCWGPGATRFAPGFPGVLTSREHTTTVTDPLGHRTVNYFSTAVDASFTGWSTYEYSLPFTRNHDAQRRRRASTSTSRGRPTTPRRHAAALGVRALRARPDLRGGDAGHLQHQPAPGAQPHGLRRRRRHLRRRGQFQLRRPGALPHADDRGELPRLERPHPLRQLQPRRRGPTPSTPPPTPAPATRLFPAELALGAGDADLPVRLRERAPPPRPTSATRRARPR